MSTTFPPPESGRHGWADLLRLLDDVRSIAFDKSIDDADRARRIRDRFGEYDGIYDEEKRS